MERKLEQNMLSLAAPPLDLNVSELNQGKKVFQNEALSIVAVFAGVIAIFAENMYILDSNENI